MQTLIGTTYRPVLSSHTDELVAREQSWGAYTKPEAYLDSFNRFVRDQLNESTALAVVVNRPRDLTREQLREVKLLLDGNGYSEAHLQAAWRNKSNQDIAASIIGFIRRAALGDPLFPDGQRVDRAMKPILASRPGHPSSANGWTGSGGNWGPR